MSVRSRVRSCHRVVRQACSSSSKKRMNSAKTGRLTSFCARRKERKRKEKRLTLRMFIFCAKPGEADRPPPSDAAASDPAGDDVNEEELVPDAAAAGDVVSAGDAVATERGGLSNRLLFGEFGECGDQHVWAVEKGLAGMETRQALTAWEEDPGTSAPLAAAPAADTKPRGAAGGSAPGAGAAAANDPRRRPTLHGDDDGGGSVEWCLIVRCWLIASVSSSQSPSVASPMPQLPAAFAAPWCRLPPVFELDKEHFRRNGLAVLACCI